MTVFVCEAREAEPYFTASNLPNLRLWYSPPPKVTSVDFSYDVMQHLWGKTQRNDPAVAQQAVWDASYGMYVVTRRFSTAFGTSISEENVPALYEMLTDCFYTVNNVCTRPKSYYRRTRPYVMFHESTLVPKHEATYANDGSFPSTHAAMGWLMALLLSEVNPPAQNKLLSIGYDFGQNRVIAGYHWQSDVDAGRMAASTLYARLRSDMRFQEQMRLAKQEFQERTGYSYGDGTTGADVLIEPKNMPDILQFLPLPPDTTTVAFMRDVNHYFDGKAQRDAGMDISIDANATSVDVLAERFEPSFGCAVSNESLPDVYDLLKTTLATALAMSMETHSQQWRKSPLEQFGERELSAGGALAVSYPSDEALAAWCVALLLIEVNPEVKSHNGILKCGFEYGQEAVLAGMCWQSDVEAARLLASAACARLHACDAFLELLSKARKQYVDFKYSVPHDPVLGADNKDAVAENALDGVDEPEKREGGYSINGVRAGRNSTGIVVRPGRKDVKRRD